MSEDVESKAVILAVDDKPEVLFVLTKLVAKHLPGCELLTAASAEEGLALALRKPPDVALVDLEMPGISGIEMTRRLKANQATACFPVVLATANEVTAELKAEGLESGADDFIAKPIENVELIAKIKAMLRIKRAEDELRNANVRLESKVRERTAALAERVHELQCLASLAEAIEQCRHSTGDLLARAVRLLPQAWLSSGDVSARIVLGEREYTTGKPCPPGAALTADILVEEQPAGTVEAGCICEGSSSAVQDDSAPKQGLLETVAKRLGAAVEHIQAREQILVERLALEQKNIALREVLASVQADKDDVGRAVLANVERIVSPILGSLEPGLDPHQRRLLALLQDSLQEITSPFLHRLSATFDTLTPTEVRLCELIRRGLSGKEIAELEHMSTGTVRTHRFQIRRKLGLLNRKVNLATYLRQELLETGKPRGGQ